MLQKDYLFVQDNEPIINAMQVIEKGIYKISFVIDKNKKVKGTITDGDIRRGILNGKKLEDSVSEIMNQDFKYENINGNLKLAKENMKKSAIRHLPILSETGELIDLFIDDFDLYKIKKNTVLIMAGGKGKRLRPLTEECPKPMILIKNIPILEIILLNCIEEGFVDFYFSVFYLKEKIINYFGDGSKWGVNIKYIEEDKPLGTAGSLALIKEDLKLPLIILNGDVLTKLNITSLLDFHNSRDSVGTICSRNYSINIPFGVIQSDNDEFISLQEKPIFDFQVNAGIYVINPELIKFINENEYLDMPEFIKYIYKKNKKITVFPIHEYWLDVGIKESLDIARKEWQNK